MRYLHLQGLVSDPNDIENSGIGVDSRRSKLLGPFVDLITDHDGTVEGTYIADGECETSFSLIRQGRTWHYAGEAWRYMSLHDTPDDATDLVERPDNEKTKLGANPALKLGIWRIRMRNINGGPNSSFVFEIAAPLSLITQFRDTIFETNEDECDVPRAWFERLRDSQFANTSTVLNTVPNPYEDDDA